MPTLARSSLSRVCRPILASIVPSLIRVSEGIVESLQQETSHLGIRSLLIEPGRFRTNLLSAGNMMASSSSIPDYAEFSKTLIKAFGEADQKQPGDLGKLVDVVVDLVRGEGVAEGKELPLRLPLGSDCYGLVKGTCEEMLGVLEQWEGVIRSTNFEG